MQINADGAMGENCVEYRKFGIDSKFASIIKTCKATCIRHLQVFDLARVVRLEWLRPLAVSGSCRRSSARHKPTAR